MSKHISFGIVLFVSGLMAVWAGAASAHAMLKSARPGVGSTVAAPPRVIELDFSEGVVPSFSTIALHDGAGHLVRIGRPGTGDEATILIAPIVGPLPPGSYTVTWHAVSVDTHRTQGSFAFTIGR